MKLQLILLDDLFYRGTGPTGPQGPVSIAVGVTTTTDPGTNASVNNVGTDDNVILNFNIPIEKQGQLVLLLLKPMVVNTILVQITFL